VCGLLVGGRDGSRPRPRARSARTHPPTCHSTRPSPACTRARRAPHHARTHPTHPTLHGVPARRATSVARAVEDAADGARGAVQDGAKAVGRKAEDATNAVKDAARDVRKS
jgi:hypothetical protein